MAGLIEFGASPRGPIGLVQAARALALLRGRGHVEEDDIRDLAPDVLRHRIVLSYDALSDGVTVDELLERVLATVAQPGADRLIRADAPDTRIAGCGARDRGAAHASGGAPRPRAAGGAIDRGAGSRAQPAGVTDPAGRSPRCRGGSRNRARPATSRTNPATTCATSMPLRAPALAPPCSPARPRESADDVDRARPVPLDGVRNGASPEGRCRRGGGARVRTARRSSCRQRGADRFRRRGASRAASARLQAGDGRVAPGSGAGGRARRAPRARGACRCGQACRAARGASRRRRHHL